MRYAYETRVCIWLVILFSVFYTRYCSADEWLVGSGFSLHAKNPDRYNKRNLGLGYEKKIDRNWSVFAGGYQNSLYRDTLYVGGSYTPYNTSVSGLKLGVGVAGMIATGYSEKYPLMPYASLFAKAEGEKYGLNVYWIPTIVVGIQFKMKF